MATLATDHAAINARQNRNNAINGKNLGTGIIAVTAAVTFDDGSVELSEYSIPKWSVSDTDNSTIEGWILGSNNDAYQVFAKRHGISWRMMESAEVIEVEM